MLKDFVSTFFAAVMALMVVGVGFAYFTADPAVKTFCHFTTANPMDQTACTIRLTLNP